MTLELMILDMKKWLEDLATYYDEDKTMTKNVIIPLFAEFVVFTNKIAQAKNQKEFVFAYKKLYRLMEGITEEYDTAFKEQNGHSMFNEVKK